MKNFDDNTKAIRVKFRSGREYQTRVFFGIGATRTERLENALIEAREFMFEMARAGFRVSMTEAKRVNL